MRRDERALVAHYDTEGPMTGPQGVDEAKSPREILRESREFSGALDRPDSHSLIATCDRSFGSVALTRTRAGKSRLVPWARRSHLRATSSRPSSRSRTQKYSAAEISCSCMTPATVTKTEKNNAGHDQSNVGTIRGNRKARTQKNTSSSLSLNTETPGRRRNEGRDNASA